MAGFILGLAIMMTTPATADALKDEIAPTGRLRVAIAISPAGGAFWSTKTETGYAGVPVVLGKAMAEQLGVPSNLSRTTIRGRWWTRCRRAPGTSPSCRRIRSVRAGWRSGRSTRSRTRPTSSNRAPRSRIHNARSARDQGRRGQQHHHDARRDRASEERQGDGLPDLR